MTLQQIEAIGRQLTLFLKMFADCFASAPDQRLLQVYVQGQLSDIQRKKLPETDAIFENLKLVHAQSARDPATLRISLDTKAKVKIGEFSRGGVARGPEAVQAVDHDLRPEGLLAPAGILEWAANQLHIVFATTITSTTASRTSK